MATASVKALGWRVRPESVTRQEIEVLPLRFAALAGGVWSAYRGALLDLDEKGTTGRRRETNVMRLYESYKPHCDSRVTSRVSQGAIVPARAARKIR